MHIPTWLSSFIKPLYYKRHGGFESLDPTFVLVCIFLFLASLPIFYTLAFRYTYNPSNKPLLSFLEEDNDSSLFVHTGVISSTSFFDCNGPGVESMLYFHDLLIVTLLPFLFGVLSCVLSRFYETPSHRYLISSQALEFTWTVLPILALVCLCFPSLSLLYLLDEVGQPLSTFKIQGHQWYWHYESDESKPLFCDSYLLPVRGNHLRVTSSLNVPSGIVLRFLVTSADVLHS